MTYFQAYLLTRLDPIHGLANFLIAFGLAASFFALIIHGPNGEWDRFKNACKLTLSIIAIGALLRTLVPTTKEAAFIYIAPAIVNNQDVQKTLKQIPELSGLGLEYLKETLKTEIKEKVAGPAKD